MRPRTAFLLSLLLALGVGYFGFGGAFYDAAIGLDPRAFPLGEWLDPVGRLLIPDLGMTAAGGAFGVLLLLLAGGVGFLTVRSAVRARGGVVSPGRRSLLGATGAGVLAGVLGVALGAVAGLARALRGVGHGGRGWQPMLDQIFVPAPYTHPEYPDSWRGSRVRAHRRLGRTEFQVSDIVLGTGRISGTKGEEVARLALERGVNYFDTAPDYAGSGSEEAMGRALRAVPRDELFVATKFCTPRGHLPAGTPVRGYMQALEGSLRRLGLDHVDLVHIHSCDEVERLLDPNVHEAFDRLREQGKVRFLGVSTHTPRLEEVVDAAIRSGRFDVMMVAYHFGIWPHLGELIRRARVEQDMGVVAMKTLKGAKHRGLAEFRPYADSYAQAALRWALANPDISCAVVSFFEPQHVDEFLQASGRPLGDEDLAVLERYDRAIAGSYCAPHCGRCLDACPEGVPIHDVLRHRMYFEDYGWEKIAIEHYAALERDASACLGCAAPCLGSCPLGIDIPTRTREAHALLRIG